MQASISTPATPWWMRSSRSPRLPADRARMISSFDWEATTPEWALGFKFDIVLRGREATPFEEPHA